MYIPPTPAGDLMWVWLPLAPFRKKKVINRTSYNNVLIQYFWQYNYYTNIQKCFTLALFLRSNSYFNYHRTRFDNCVGLNKIFQKNYLANSDTLTFLGILMESLVSLISCLYNYVLIENTKCLNVFFKFSIY